MRGKWPLVVVPIAALLGCGSSASRDAGFTDPYSAAPRVHTTVTLPPEQVFSVPPDPQLTEPPATEAAPPSSAPAPAAPMLTGYGATVDAWNAAHTADPNFAAGSSYDPDPSLVRDGDSRFDDRYYSVNPIGGFVTDYSERFALGTPIAVARAAALRELPSDARSVWFAIKDSCAQEAFQSSTLGTALSAAGDPAGWALVEYSSGSAADHYDPSDISEGLWSFGSSDDATPAGALGC